MTEANGCFYWSVWVDHASHSLPQMEKGERKREIRGRWRKGARQTKNEEKAGGVAEKSRATDDMQRKPERMIVRE